MARLTIAKLTAELAESKERAEEYRILLCNVHDALIDGDYSFRTKFEELPEKITEFKNKIKHREGIEDGVVRVLRDQNYYLMDLFSRLILSAGKVDPKDIEEFRRREHERMQRGY